MTTTYSLATDIGKVRLELGDWDFSGGKGVRPLGANLQDEEIQVWLTAEAASDSPVLRAALRACEALAAEWAKTHDFTDGPRSESYSQSQVAWAKKAEALRERLDSQLVRTALVWPP